MFCKGTVGRMTSTTNDSEPKREIIDKTSEWGTLDQRWGKVRFVGGCGIKPRNTRTVSPAPESQTPNQPLEQ